jgi:hypothetical protein
MMAGACGEPPTMREIYTLPRRIKDDDVRPGVRRGDDAGGLDLSPEHRRMLFEESSLDPEIAAERGYRTIRSRSELSEYPDWQRRLGLYVPMRSPDGHSTSSQIRPNKPRRKGPKYETPAASKMIADVHPRNLEAVGDAGRDLWMTEGVKKGDALASRGLCAISLAGVWNFAVAGTKGRELLSCFDSVALEGRRVFVVFDSDVMTKPEVQEALARLVAALEGRGADVFVVYLPDTGDGKTGVDDYLAAGNTVEDLRGLARRFDTSEVARIRLSRDERLRLALENAGVRYRSIPWKGMGGKSASDVAKALLTRAAKSGKVVDDGISVRAAWGPLAVEAGIGSSRTMGKAFRRLEESGFGYRDAKGRKPGEATRFVVRASVKQYERKPRPKEKATNLLQGFVPTTLHLRALHNVREKVPALRWSKPAFKPKSGTVSDTRRVRQGPKPEARDRIERLGKTRGAVIDELVMAGGSLSLEELAAAMQIKRVRDLRRRALPMLEDFGIITVVEPDGAVSLAGDWRAMLEEARRIGEEVEAEKHARERCRRRSRAYRSRERTKATPHWTQDPEASGAVEDLERVEDVIEAGLSEDDRRALEAIEAFEGKYGLGSFKWNDSGTKELFYSGPVWCDIRTDQLRRIRRHLDLLKASKRKVAA